jgi:peptide chain release factor subunit 1
MLQNEVHVTNASNTAMELRASLRRLADWQPTSLPLVSAYLDLRPEPERPELRPGLIVLRDMLRDAIDSFPEHSAGHASLAADNERISSHIEDDLLPGAVAAAIFACDAENRFESVVTADRVESDVSVAPRPKLLPLARLADFDPALVGLADTNTLRIFALRSGELIELGLLDDEPGDYQLSEVGGWSQARFQRHVKEHREQFAELGAQALEAFAHREHATALLLAGDEVAVPVLENELSKPMAEMVRGVVRCEIRATLEEVSEKVLPELERVREEDAHDAADRLIDATEADGMGISGVEATRRALELGQVEELILDSGEKRVLQEETAEDLAHLAAATDARIRFAKDHVRLRSHDGVCGLLRFRLDRAGNQPKDEGGESAPTVSSTGEPLSPTRSK